MGSAAVILIFSVNRSNAFQGIARMRSFTGRSQARSDPFHGFGRLIDVEWLRLADVEFGVVSNLRNPLDESRQVAFSRDGQELSHSVGAELCRHFDIKVFLEDEHRYESLFHAAPRRISANPAMSSPAPLLALPAPEPPLALPPPAALQARAVPSAGHGFPGYPPIPQPYGVAPMQYADPRYHPHAAHPWPVAPQVYITDARHSAQKKKKKRRRDTSSSSYSVVADH